MVDIKLTTKQQKFADNYIETGNAKQAAIQAGYSKKTAAVIGAENLIKPNVKAYIDKKMKEIADSKIAGQKEVLELLTSVMRGQVKEVLVAGNGDAVEVPTSTKDRIKAAELIGKRYSLWKDVVDINSSDIKIVIGGDTNGD
ncbi:terminase small subunit [Fructilactobacillus sanfranciscensis]|uniref:terminase small subunit n=1 Tax=Fructilactobacillus sanfranciscensis TaxID=1625 RepID=UPI00145678FC|nr:terminase small subunit [Fructilactobacillus sanfranciscensis]